MKRTGFLSSAEGSGSFSLSLLCPLTRSVNPEADPGVMRSEVCSIGWALFKKKHTDYTCTIEYEVWEGGVRLKTSLAVH